MFYYLDNNSDLTNWIEVIFDEVDFRFCESNLLTSFFKEKEWDVKIRKCQTTPILKTSSKFNEYFLNREKKIKKAIGNKANKLSEIGGFHLTKYTKPDEIDKGLHLIHEIDCLSWKFDSNSDMASREGQLIFYETLAKQLSEKGAVSLYILEFIKTKEPIAFEYIINYNNQHLIVKHSYKEKYRKYSPGVLIRYEILKNLLDGNLKVIDTWGEIDQFKKIWCEEKVDRFSVSVKNISINI